MSLYDADRLLDLLAAVEGLPPAHDCPGLSGCLKHPRLHVWKERGVPDPEWVVTSANLTEISLRTHAEAIAYATSRARADQLAAITHSEGTDAHHHP